MSAADGSAAPPPDVATVVGTWAATRPRRGLIDMLGVRSGRLVVVARDVVMGVDHHGGARWRCRCDCGGETIATGSQLRGPRARQSCGRCGRSPAAEARQHRSGPRARTLSMSRASKRLLVVGETLDEVGASMNLTRERIRQMERDALQVLALDPLTCELADVEHTDSRGEVDHADDGSGALSTADAVAGLSMLCGGGGAWGWVR